MHKPTSDVQRAGWGELGLVALALSALTGLVLFLTDGVILFTRPFWVDEWFTVLVARRDSVAQLIGDLHAGADGGTGLFHGLIWAMHRVGVPLSPLALRAFSLACVVGALLLLYAVLRSRTRAEAAIGGVLAAGAHPLVVAHSYEARFYGPWLLCATLYAWTLGRTFDHAARARAMQAIAAVLLCAVHFYGVISLVLMIAAVVVSRSRARVPESLRALRPSLAGFVAVLLIIPLAMGQRAAFGVRSWIPEFTIGQLGALLAEFWVAGVPLLVVVALAIGWWVRRGTTPSLRVVAVDVLSHPGIAALLGLALVPFALAVVSIAGQPSMLSRYAVTAALVWGPLAAVALQYLGRTPARIARLLFVWFWLVSYTSEVRAKLRFAAEVSASRQAVASVPGGVPILTPSVHLLYPVAAESLGGTARLNFLELPDSLLDRAFSATERRSRTKFVITERDLARVHAGRFGFPAVMRPAAVDSLQEFAVLGSRLRFAPAFGDLSDFARRVFPAHQVTVVTDVLALFRRQ